MFLLSFGHLIFLYAHFSSIFGMYPIILLLDLRVDVYWVFFLYTGMIFYLRVWSYYHECLQLTFLADISLIDFKWTRSNRNIRIRWPGRTGRYLYKNRKWRLSECVRKGQGRFLGKVVKAIVFPQESMHDRVAIIFGLRRKCLLTFLRVL